MAEWLHTQGSRRDNTTTRLGCVTPCRDGLGAGKRSAGIFDGNLLSFVPTGSRS